MESNRFESVSETITVIDPTDSKKNKPKKAIKERSGMKDPYLKDQDDKWFWQKYKLQPSRIAVHSISAVMSIYGIVNFPWLQSYKTTLWAYLMACYTMFGIYGGAHRHWSHRAFKANKPLKVILAVGYMLSMIMVPIRTWVLLHRLHHKNSDTDADPHNVRRGFFYSHIGWALISRPREVLEKMPGIDMSDVHSDPVVKFFERHFNLLTLVINLFTVAVPVYLWNEAWSVSLWAAFLRHQYTLHQTLAINSFAHRFGAKPYAKNIPPSDNRILSYLSGGEGWHNYHHAFPMDYRASEVGGARFEPTAWLIRFFEKIGWAYDLKRPNDELVKMKILNKGDGSLLKAIAAY